MTIQFEQGEHEIQNLSCMTTVNDVIYAMIKTGNSSLKSFHPSQLVIVESWRKQERPLPPRTRLLKVWKSWGVEQAHVKYYLKQAQRLMMHEYSSTNPHFSIPFRQGKSWRSSFRKRRNHPKKPEKNAIEIQIDGPWVEQQNQFATSSSSSNSSATSMSLSESTTSSSSSSNASYGSEAAGNYSSPQTSLIFPYIAIITCSFD